MPLARSQESMPARPTPSRRARWVSGLVVIVVALVIVLVGRGLIGSWFRGVAANHLNRGTLSDAQQWLGRADRLSSHSPESQLLLARLHRQLGHRDRWEALMGSLDGSAADAAELRLERRLGSIRWGEDRAVGHDELDQLVKQGISRDDAAATLVLGLLETGNPALAERVLQQWETDCQSPAQLAWALGVHRQRAQHFASARQSFEDALSMEPDHDNARLGLAQMLQQLNELPEAVEHFTAHLQRWPESEPALLGLSRCSRRLGRVEVAAALMQQAIAAETPSPALWLEAAEVAYFLGDYKEAVRRFEQTDLEGPQLAITIRTAATAQAMAGRWAQAQELFDRYLSGYSLQYRREALENRVREDASDMKAAEELRQILSGQYTPPARQAESSAISTLFSLHCAACHGQSGEGDGPANRHLYPPARNLRSDAYRLVTTSNRFPSPDDIRAVIRSGIPGTSMPAFAELSDVEVDQLAAETYRLRQAGFRSDLIEGFKQLGDELDEESVEEVVSRLGTAGQRMVVPAWPSLVPDQLALGRALFEQAACNRCHGVDGAGNSSLLLLDERGNPTLPRNLVQDPMKSGEDRAALYTRLRLGMPGTAHPANPTLSDEQLAILVEYCLGLAQQPKRRSTNHQRASQVNRYALEAANGL